MFTDVRWNRLLDYCCFQSHISHWVLLRNCTQPLIISSCLTSPEVLQSLLSNELCQISVTLMALWASWQCAYWGPPSLAGPRCEAGLVGAVWVVPSPQFPTSSQHQGKWATEAMPLLNAPLGMLIDLLWHDKQKVCVPVHLGKIKSTVLAAWHRAVCLPSACVDSFNLRFQTSSLQCWGEKRT